MNEVFEELPHLTPRQLDTLAWIWRYWVAHNHAPTQREIAAAMGASSRTATAAPFVDPLVAKGYLVRTSAASRNIKMTAQAIAKLRFERITSSENAAWEREPGEVTN